MSDNRVATWMSEIRVLDGGLGSECARRSPLPVDGHKAWSCRLLKEDPNLVCDIHKSFLLAGSDVLSTNTYQAAPHTLANALNITEAEAVELMRHAVRLVNRAIAAVAEEQANTRPDRCNNVPNRKLPVLIAGSLGPYGACVADGSEYTGSYVDKISFSELVDFHLTRAEILLSAGVDFLAWETIPIATEVAAICEVMRRLPDALAWVSVASADGQTTVGGDPLHEIGLELQNCEQIFAIGINCNIDHDRIGLALSNLSGYQDPCGPGTDDGYHPPRCSARPGHSEHSSASRKLLIAYANSGEIWMTSKRTKNRRGNWVWPPNKGPSDWARSISKWAMRRDTQFSRRPTYPLAQWVGGCCRVTPQQIRSLAELIKPDEFSYETEEATSPCSRTSVVIRGVSRQLVRKRSRSDQSTRHQPKRVARKSSL
ncbi:Homocysteine S-methyltransferase [Paragonimus heterotremus]|uniref:Homocysteine S-methyltransferase n=1 Tax=Paragonimus heterotremus TaxID=100268 RepID=A0A8J4TBL4_9TREM|nr:Homocysteine S-methyltransferase [Paragonimus heterotremus]